MNFIAKSERKIFIFIIFLPRRKILTVYFLVVAKLTQYQDMTLLNL